MQAHQKEEEGIRRGMGQESKRLERRNSWKGATLSTSRTGMLNLAPISIQRIGRIQATTYPSCFQLETDRDTDDKIEKANANFLSNLKPF